MAQALKKAEVAKVNLNKKLSTSKSQKNNDAKTTETTVLNFDNSKSFSRFLESSCDCC